MSRLRVATPAALRCWCMDLTQSLPAEGSRKGKGLQRELMICACAADQLLLLGTSAGRLKRTLPFYSQITHTF